jgi:predicted porin
MAKLGVSVALILGLAGAAYVADSRAVEMPAKASSSREASPTAPPACTDPSEFVTTNCTLTWYGITIYGAIDAGAGWQSHGAPLDALFTAGSSYVVQKMNRSSIWSLAPNATSQSAIGIRGSQTLGSGFSFVFDWQTGFDPYSLKLANGPGSLDENAGVPLDRQTANGDSSRAGQWYNGLGYVGLSSPTYGTLTVFRQNSLTLDGVIAYDPMVASYAFSWVGFSGITCGVGDTEDCRYSTSLKYRVNVGQFRGAALWQFGGYGQNNGANGAYQFQLGADIPKLANGVLSIDAIYSYVRDAVALSLGPGSTNAAGVPIPPFLPQTLTATISDDTGIMLLAKYDMGSLALYGGFEWIRFGPP